MDGGAGICAEQHQKTISKKSSFLLSIKEVFSGRLSIPPCCIAAPSRNTAPRSSSAGLKRAFGLRGYTCPLRALIQREADALAALIFAVFLTAVALAKAGCGRILRLFRVFRVFRGEKPERVAKGNVLLC